MPNPDAPKPGPPERVTMHVGVAGGLYEHPGYWHDRTPVDYIRADVHERVVRALWNLLTYPCESASAAARAALAALPPEADK